MLFNKWETKSTYREGITPDDQKTITADIKLGSNKILELSNLFKGLAYTRIYDGSKDEELGAWNVYVCVGKIEDCDLQA